MAGRAGGGAFFLWWELSTRIRTRRRLSAEQSIADGARSPRSCGGGEPAVHIGTSCLRRRWWAFWAGTLLGTAVAVGMWWSEKFPRPTFDLYLVVLNVAQDGPRADFHRLMGAGMGAIVVMTLAISLIVTILSMYQGFCPRMRRSCGLRTSVRSRRQIL